MSTGRTLVTLLRHGEVDNPGNVLYGRLPGFHLSDVGRRQAVAVAEHLVARDRRVTAIWSSPLERARETAQPLAEALGLDVRVDERLIESGHVFQGRRQDRLGPSITRPGEWRRYVNPCRPSWGEPYRAIAQRMHSAIDDARAAHPGGHVLCVSHQSPIWVSRRAYQGQPLWHDPRRRQCAHASLTTVTFDGDTMSGIGYEAPAGAL